MGSKEGALGAQNLREEGVAITVLVLMHSMCYYLPHVTSTAS